jgi:glycosyltransferase involved in cell wall biosynthesis
LPRVSIIVACRNEAAFIQQFLNSVFRQTVPCEVVIADGLSCDGTREILLKNCPAIQLIENPRLSASSGLNLALKASSGDIIIRMDAHTEYAADYVETCLAVLTETGATNVGGPARTRSEGFWQSAIAAAFHSPFFSGGARFHNENYEGRVDTVPYGCWRRSDLEALGGFDETLVRNQDDELNLRIHRTGGFVWQSPRIRSWYAPRRSLSTLARQYYEYGVWKVAVMRKHGRPAQVRHLVPALALLSFGLLAIACPVSAAARRGMVLSVAAYSFAIVLASLGCLMKSRQVKPLPALPFIFATVHLAYGSGWLSGLSRSRATRNV